MVSALSLGLLNYLVYFADHIESTSEQKISPDSTVIEAVNDLFYDYHIQKKYIKVIGHQVKVIIPSRFHFVPFYRSLVNELQTIDASILSCEERVREKSITIRINRHQKPALHLILYKRSSLSEIAGSVAIIVDDFGYVYNETVRDFLFFPTLLPFPYCPV